MKQIPSPPFWGGVRVKKWSPFFDSGARSPIFGHLKMPSAHFFWGVLIPIQNCPVKSEAQIQNFFFWPRLFYNIGRQYFPLDDQTLDVGFGKEVWCGTFSQVRFVHRISRVET